MDFSNTSNAKDIINWKKCSLLVYSIAFMGEIGDVWVASFHPLLDCFVVSLLFNVINQSKAIANYNNEKASNMRESNKEDS